MNTVINFNKQRRNNIMSNLMHNHKSKIKSAIAKALAVLLIANAAPVGVHAWPGKNEQCLLSNYVKSLPQIGGNPIYRKGVRFESEEKAREAQERFNKRVSGKIPYFRFLEGNYMHVDNWNQNINLNDVFIIITRIRNPIILSDRKALINKLSQAFDISPVFFSNPNVIFNIQKEIKLNHINNITKRNMLNLWEKAAHLDLPANLSNDQKFTILCDLNLMKFYVEKILKSTEKDHCNEGSDFKYGDLTRMFAVTLRIGDYFDPIGRDFMRCYLEFAEGIDNLVNNPHFDFKSVSYEVQDLLGAKR